MADRSNAPGDRELSAIAHVMDALDGLDSDALHRVLDYVFRRLGISTARSGVRPTTGEAPATSGAPSAVEENRSAGRVVADIKSLKELKQPTSANQMAALVALYLSEFAPPEERRTQITAVDIQKYFVQAKFPLPNRPQQTLPNAAAAGYFDSVGGGTYRLNPVGYNLVVHQMQDSDGVDQVRKVRRKKPKTKR